MTEQLLYTNSEFDYVLKRIGFNVAMHRKLNNLTQEELAEITGLSRGYVAKIEAAKSTPQMTIEILYKISKALGICLQDLFEGTTRF